MTVSFALEGKRVWVAGHRGMAGSAIVRRLAAERCELVSVGRQELDLRNQGAVEAWMPTNLYGPGDNYDLQQGHVVAALQMKIHRAKRTGAPTVEIWGSGTPRREFLYVDDLADALVFMMKHYSEELHLNVGTGTDLTIPELGELIAKVAQYEGALVYDRSKPDGTPRKVMDVGRLTALGWVAKTALEQGLRQAYEAYAKAFRSQQEA